MEELQVPLAIAETTILVSDMRGTKEVLVDRAF